jgi:hypothetical protein
MSKKNKKKLIFKRILAMLLAVTVIISGVALALFFTPSDVKVIRNVKIRNTFRQLK